MTDLTKLHEYNGSYFIGQLTNQFLFTKVDDSLNEEELMKHGLDIYAFNDSKAIHYFRSSINQDFKFFEYDDSALNETDFFDEGQFLDIDEKRSSKTFQKAGDIVFATGGGQYTLPYDKMHDIQIVIRYYLAYEETGKLYVKDSRPIKLMEFRGGNHE